VAVPGALAAAVEDDLEGTARAVRELGGVEAFLAAPPPERPTPQPPE
jgi:hypothetical protein